jgi:rhodanese-related sulfurtransferase
MRKASNIIALLIAAVVLTISADSSQAADKTQVASTCKSCHKQEANTLRGFMKAGSQTDNSFKVQVDKDVWDINYDSSTKLDKNLTTIRELANERILMVRFKEEGGKVIATEVSYKTPMTFSEPNKVIEVDELAALLKKDPKKANYVLLDVRGVSYYEEGHLPGAIVLPNYRFAKYKDRLPKDKNTLIITYCNGYTCSMSPNFYRVLTEGYGYKNVKMFASGFPAWRTTGQPVHTEPEFLKYVMDNGKANSYILIDLRSKDKAEKEHIPNAANFPAAFVEALYNALPSDHKARIILYSDNMKEAESVMRTLRINAYDVVSVLNGGIDAWKKKGYPTASNSLLTKIDYKAALLPGRISVDEFKGIVKNIPADKIVLDVRRPDERAKKGKINGTINIPVDTLDWRWTELPKDKEIILHCQDGPRASVAFDVLKEHGFNVRYLFAGFKWNKDGTYEIQAK